MKLPLMPLNSVLFPWMPTVLSIFEKRYLRMLEEVLKGPRIFGTALIAEGKEVGGPALPHRVGTEIIIARAWPAEESGWRVVGIGRHRFSINRMLSHHPFPMAEVDFAGWSEANQPPPAPSLVAEVRCLFEEHLALLMRLLGLGSEVLEIPDHPARLSYMVAAHLGAEALQRQQLLEIPLAVERLEAELALLREDLAKLRLFAAANSTDPRKAELN